MPVFCCLSSEGRLTSFRRRHIKCSTITVYSLEGLKHPMIHLIESGAYEVRNQNAYFFIVIIWCMPTSATYKQLCMASDIETEMLGSKQFRHSINYQTRNERSISTLMRTIITLRTLYCEGPGPAAQFSGWRENKLRTSMRNKTFSQNSGSQPVVRDPLPGGLQLKQGLTFILFGDKKYTNRNCLQFLNLFHLNHYRQIAATFQNETSNMQHCSCTIILYKLIRQHKDQWLTRSVYGRI